MHSMVMDLNGSYQLRSHANSSPLARSQVHRASTGFDVGPLPAMSASEAEQIRYRRGKSSMRNRYRRGKGSTLDLYQP